MTEAAGGFRTVRLALEDGIGCGYAFTAPLTEDGRIDAGAWRKAPERCVAIRFWRGEDDRSGHLVQTRSRRWTFRFELDNDPQDDESGWKSDALRFTPGAIVAIAGQDGVTRRFRVIAVEAAR